MSEAQPSASASGARSAGRMIREAREAQGLDIGVLSATIKVSQQKLEALEADRFADLPDATFARALAQTVCRSLKIDPQPVLAMLPHAGSHRLDHLSEGINTPFRDRPGQREAADGWAALARPAVLGPLLLLAAAAALYVAPAGWISGLVRWPPLGDRSAAAIGAAPSTSTSATRTTAAADATAATNDGAASAGRSTAQAPSEAADRIASTAPAPAPSTTGASPDVAGAASAGAPSVLEPDGSSTLQLRANAQSWVEVVDGRSRVLLSRMLQPGETVALDGNVPLKLKVGNAAGTEAVFRGRTLDLVGSTRDNVARLELK